MAADALLQRVGAQDHGCCEHSDAERLDRRRRLVEKVGERRDVEECAEQDQLDRHPDQKERVGRPSERTGPSRRAPAGERVRRLADDDGREGGA